MGLKIKGGDAELSLKRGAQSWNYIYTLLAIVLGIEGLIISFIPSLVSPRNIIAFFVVATLTTWLFLRSGRFHNLLFRFKSYVEEKEWKA
jgi:ABC-type multidrug transport system permease subunit